MRTLALVLGVAGLLVGCGGTSTPSGSALSKTEYETSFKVTVKRIEGGPKIDPPPDSSPQEQGAALGKGLDRIRELASALDQLNPPAEVRHAQDQFVAGLREIADQGEQAVTALKTGDEGAARRMVNTFAKPATLRKITAARQDFVRKGYHLGEVNPSP